MGQSLASFLRSGDLDISCKYHENLASVEARFFYTQNQEVNAK